MSTVWSDQIGISYYARPSPDTTSTSGYAINALGQRSTLSYDPANGMQGSVIDSHIWLAQTNVVYTVGLYASQYGQILGYQGGGQISFSSFVDPTFSIASSVPNAGAYSVLVSPGIGNVSAAPEPMGFALGAVGLWGVAAYVRIQRKT